MSTDKDFDFVWDSGTNVPEKALTWLRLELVNRLGSSVTQMFPEFAKAFPLTAQAMAVQWPAPKLYGRNFEDKIIARLGMIRNDANLFFDCTPSFSDVSGSSFDRNRRMLPKKWVELYRWFHSFHIVTAPQWLLGWKNTPTSWSNRQDIAGICELTNQPKKAGKSWAASHKISERSFFARMWTDGGDVLWLDEERCDHKVYHMRNNSFKDIVVLDNADEKLDMYLAHIVSGGSPIGFDFRAPIAPHRIANHGANKSDDDSPAIMIETQDAKAAIESESAASFVQQSATVQPLIVRLEQWLKEYRVDFLEQLLPPATDAQLAAIEKKLASPLPEYFKQWLRWRNGQATSFYASFHPITAEMMMSSDSILSTLECMAEIVGVGDVPEFSWSEYLVPFMDNGGGDLTCIDCRTGIIYHRNHEDCDLDEVYPSFSAWLVEMVDTLEQNGSKGWSFDV